MEREKYFFNFNYISFGHAHIYSVARKCLPGQFEKRALKYTSCLRWLICPNSVRSCPVVFPCCLLRHVGPLAANTIRIQSPVDLAKQECYVQAAGWKKFLPIWRVQLNWGQISPFHWSGFFFAHASPHFLSESFNTFFKNLFLFIFFFIYSQQISQSSFRIFVWPSSERWISDVKMLHT